MSRVIFTDTCSKKKYFMYRDIEFLEIRKSLHANQPSVIYLGFQFK